MRAKMGTMRRRAITVSATEEYLEVRLDSILELLRFTGIAIAGIRMGLGGSGTDRSEQVSDAGDSVSGEQKPDPSKEANSDGENGQEDAADEGFDRDVFLSYRSIRIQVA